MKRKLVILGILGIGLLIIVGVSLLSRGSDATACGSFINMIIKGDAEGSYLKLSTNTQNTTNPEAWAKQVGSLRAFYDGATPELISATVITNPDGTTQNYEQYSIKNGSGSYTLHCYSSVENNTIEAFSSQVNVPNFEEQQEEANP